MAETRKLALAIPAEQIDKYNSLMSVDRLDYKENNIPRFAAVDSWTVNAGDGYEIDVKVCSSDDGDSLWCEAVLFLDGCEQDCSDVECKLDGEWELEANGICFKLAVVSK